MRGGTSSGGWLKLMNVICKVEMCAYVLKVAPFAYMHVCDLLRYVVVISQSEYGIVQAHLGYNWMFILLCHGQLAVKCVGLPQL